MLEDGGSKVPIDRYIGQDIEISFSINIFAKGSSRPDSIA
jgi:hypothetical protein